MQATFTATLVDEWVRWGVTDAVVCPGSRSTPLVLALAARPELRLHVRLDERGAGFFAVGLGLATGRPALVCTTSGTAAVELHPAVVEAHHAGVPLIACTADRPPELHHVGAPQTIEQAGLFGSAVRWSCEPGVAVAEAAGTWRSLAARSVAEACDGPYGPGPVHLNLAFRDPLLAEPGPLPEGRPDGAPLYRLPAEPAIADVRSGCPGGLDRTAGVGLGPHASAEPAIADERSGRPGGLDQYGRGRGWGPRPPEEPGLGRPGGLDQYSRGLVVAGQGCGPPAQVLALAERLGWPVLADPRSGCRMVHPNVVAAADALVRSPDLRQALRPETILLLGAPWTSKALAGFLAEAARDGATVVAVDPWWRWVDPDRIVSEIHRADPAAWLAAALHGLDEVGPTAGGGVGAPALRRSLGWGAQAGRTSTGDWLARWQSAEGAAQRAIDEVLADDAAQRGGALTEPALARRLFQMLPAHAQVVAASSMPVRELEWFAPPLAAPPRVLANRGANGIDGVSSTAQGVAAAGLAPVVGVVGDLAFLHDVSSLVRPAGLLPATSCTLVVVDNAGGGIFNFLPPAVALDPARFELLFGTPQAPDVADVARGFGLGVTDVGTPEELEEALRAVVGQSHLAVVRARAPGRADNVALHDRVHEEVARVARAALGA